jgi:hypothetical protein
MKIDPIPVETALIGLYNYTRKASLPLNDHDMCRIYVDVLGQALNLKLQWSPPGSEEDPIRPPETDASKNKKKN